MNPAGQAASDNIPELPAPNEMEFVLPRSCQARTAPDCAGTLALCARILVSSSVWLKTEEEQTHLPDGDAIYLGLPAHLPAERRASVRPCRQMSSRHTQTVPSKVRVDDTRRAAGQNRCFDGIVIKRIS